jgi:carboxyl-terminal processing protease
MYSPLDWLRTRIAQWRGAKFNATAAIATLAIIIAFGIGDQVGQARHKSPVDESISKILKKDPAAPEKKVLQRAAIEAVLKATGDQWANYFPQATAKIFTQSLQGRYSGIGIWLRKNSSGVLEVSSVQKNSPAEKVGIKTLDALTEINGTSLDGASIATAVALLRGKPGSSVQLQLERNQKQYRVSVSRDGVLTGDVNANQIAPGVIYIQVSAITTNVAGEVSIALGKYSHKNGIILDLRDNPGGLIDEAASLSQIFLSEGPIVSYTRKGEADRVITSNNQDPIIAPMTVLINRSTASSAEVITGALQDRNRAVILGEKSYGKGTVQEVLPLSDGSKLEFTVGKYRTPSGRIIDQVGISPDLLVPDSLAIAKAVQVLSGLAALDKGQSTSGK